MSIIAVDLAAKFSAVCRMDWQGNVRDEFDSWGRDETQFVDMITAPWIHPDPPYALVIEDLPHAVRYMQITKNVCRLQGRIIERMNYYGAGEHVLFVPPYEWRKTYPGLETGTGAEAVVPVAGRLGYTLPDLSHRILRAGDRATAKKVATDYCAAFLIARWVLEQRAIHGSFDIPGISRHGDPIVTRPRKKKSREKK